MPNETNVKYHLNVQKRQNAKCRHQQSAADWDGGMSNVKISVQQMV